MDLQTLECPVILPTVHSNTCPHKGLPACWGRHTAHSVESAQAVLAGGPISFPGPSPLTHILIRMSARAGFIFPNLGCHTAAHVTDFQSPPLPAGADPNSTHPHPFPRAIPLLRARESPPREAAALRLPPMLG